MATVVRVIELSGRYDRDPQWVEDDVTRLSESADVMLFTEMADRDRAAMLVLPGWVTVQDTGKVNGRRECAVMFREARFRMVASDWTPISKPGNKGRLRFPIWALTVVLEDTVTGDNLVWSVAHMMAHVEDGKRNRWRRLPRAALYREAVPVWVARVDEIASVHWNGDGEAAPVWAGGDWNLNTRRPWVRAWLRTQWKGHALAFPKEGTHGARSIDGGMTTLDVEADPTAGAAPSSDHKAVSATFTHTTKGTPVPTPTPPPEFPADPFKKVTYHGKLMDAKTQAAVMVAEKHLGYELTVTQGCYNPGGVSASGGTHDGGGVVDLAPWDQAHKVKVLRDMGWAAWFRPAIPGLWPDHIHAVLIGHGKLSPQAGAQVADYERGLNGLANRADDPNRYRPDPIPTFKYPPKELIPKATKVTKARRKIEAADSALAGARLLLEQVDPNRPAPAAAVEVIARTRADLSTLLDTLPER